MEKDITPVINFWKEKVSDHINTYVPYHLPQQLKQMAALFSPVKFYFYIMNFHNLEMDYVHEGTIQVLGVKPEEFTMQKLLSMLPPEELLELEKKEALAADFLFRFLTPGQLPFYKVVYFFKVHDTCGNLHTMLHQATTLTVSEKGKVEHVLGVQTDVSHLSLLKNNRVSFVSLKDGKSYYNPDPDKGVFDPEDSDAGSELGGIYTPREAEVIKLFSEGLTSAQVAEKLFISENTVRTHRKKILEKTDCANMTELVARCLVEGVI